MARSHAGTMRRDCCQLGQQRRHLHDTRSLEWLLLFFEKFAGIITQTVLVVGRQRRDEIVLHWRGRGQLQLRAAWCRQRTGDAHGGRERRRLGRRGRARERRASGRVAYEGAEDRHGGIRETELVLQHAVMLEIADRTEQRSHHGLLGKKLRVNEQHNARREKKTYEVSGHVRGPRSDDLAER